MQTKKSSGSDGLDAKKTAQFSGQNSVPFDLQTLKHRLSLLLGKIYELFEISKNELSKNYESIHGIIQMINFDTIMQNEKNTIDFVDTLNQISGQLNIKINKAAQSIRSTVINSQTLKKLIRTKSQVLRPSLQKSMSVQKSFNSKREIAMNNSVSTKSIKNETRQNVLYALDKFVPQNKAIINKIELHNKKIERMDFFFGQWQALQIINIENKKLRQLAKFSEVKAPFLSQINLNSNQIDSLKNFAQAFLPQLKTLNLQKNHLVSIEGLQQANLAQLRRLNLSYNKIKRVNILAESYFPNLIELYLTENKIQDLQCFKKFDFPKLEILNIDRNNLKDISIIKECDFLKLQVLSFAHNDISNIDFLASSPLRHLKGLYGDYNEIKSIQFLKNCNFFNIQVIVLSNNKIDNIKVLPKLNFEKLNRLDLDRNNIESTQFMCFSKRSYESKRAKQKFPFVQL